jgi:hypothetical protein
LDLIAHFNRGNHQVVDCNRSEDWKIDQARVRVFFLGVSEAANLFADVGNVAATIQRNGMVGVWPPSCDGRASLSRTILMVGAVKALRFVGDIKKAV